MDRLGPRMLAQLSREQLADMLLMAIGSASPDGQRQLVATANAMMAATHPTPAWAVHGVLLSPDLGANIFQHLNVNSCAAASVCSEWHRQWALF